MWKNDQCWRRLNFLSLKSCCCGYSPRKLMKERGPDNSRCFHRSSPPHYWLDSYNPKNRTLLPRKRVGVGMRVIQAEHCWYCVRIKVISKRTGHEIAEPRTMTGDYMMFQGWAAEMERTVRPLSLLWHPGKSKRGDTICSLSQKRMFWRLVVSKANISKCITLITND